MAKFDFIRYANCWEDANILMEALDINDKVGVSVLSGGDNTLAMLTQNPQRIIAFDINKTQIHLFNLKKAGIKEFNYEDFIALLGVYNTEKSYELFLSLRGKMEKDSFEYFAKHPEFFKKGIINIGKFEHYFQLFKKYAVPLFSTRARIEKLASFKNIAMQKKYYEDVINNKKLDFIFNMFFGFKVMGKFGRDKSFYDYVDDKKNSGQKIREHFDYGITHIVNYNNPYMNYVLTNRFTDSCLPIYLQKENFNTIKKRIDRIIVQQTDLIGIEGKFDFFNLSDIFEYMDKKDFEKNCEKLYSLTKKNSKVAYYNMQGKKYLNKDNFKLLEKTSQALTNKMQAYFYNEFLVYKAKK